MSSTVTLLSQFREYKTSVTGSTALNELVKVGCEHFKLGDPADYELQYKSTVLDLSLPFRLANLPRGAKLNVVKSLTPRVKKGNGSPVTVKLQIISPEDDPSWTQPAAGSLIQKFTSTQTLTAVLEKYQDAIGQTLVGRTSHYDNAKLGKRILTSYTPTVQCMTRVVKTPAELDSTTLEALGLTSGNHSLRLRFQKVETGAVPIADAKAETAPAVTERVVPQKRTTQQDAPAVPTTPVPKSPTEKAPAKTEPTPPVCNSTIDPSKTIAVYKEANRPVTHQQPEESVYDMTVDQAKLYQSLLSKRAGSGQMMTRRQREELAQKKVPVVTSCIVRIRFPDHTTVQMELPASDTLKELYDLLVGKVLALTEEEEHEAAQGNAFFELVTNYPQVSLLASNEDLSKTLVKDCGLGKRSLLVYREKNTSGKEHFVKEQFLQAAKPLNDVDELALEKKMDSLPESKPTNANARTNYGGSTKSKRVPKWFAAGKR